MSVPTVQQSKLVPFALSLDNITFKNVVCRKVWNFTGDTATSEEATECGVFSALGANSGSFDFDGVLNSTPNSTEVSAKEVLGYWKDQTLLYAKVAPAGFTLSGPGHITNIKLGATVGNLVSFSATFKMDGDPTIV